MPKILWAICTIVIVLHLVRMVLNTSIERMLNPKKYNTKIYIMSGTIIVIIDFLCFYGGWKLFSYLVGVVK